MTPVSPVPAGCRIQIHLQPRAARTELAGLHGDALKIRIAAPPVDGAANEVLRQFLARRLAVPIAAVRIVHGETSRRKLVEIAGVDPDQATRALLPR